MEHNSEIIQRPSNVIGLSTDLGLSGKVRTRIINSDGTGKDWCPWFNNLILTSGMNRLPIDGYDGIMQYASRGTDNTPVRRNTTGTGFTLSQSGTTVTASGTFFVSQDVGAIIKYGISGSAGAECTVVTYNSPTSVVVSTSATVASTDAVLWQAQQTGIIAYVDSAQKLGGSDVVTFDATGGGSGIPSITLKRTYRFTAVSGTVTFKELGFGSGSSNSNNWSRVLVPGAGDTLTAGQIYEVEYSIVISIPDGSAIVPVGDSLHPSGDAFNTAGNFIVEKVPSTAQVYEFGSEVLDPTCILNKARINAITANWTQRTLASNASLSFPSSVEADSITKDAYSNGTFQVTRRSVFDYPSANTTWYGIVVGSIVNNTAFWSIKFTTPLVKDGSHTVTMAYTVTWSRVLTN